MPISLFKSIIQQPWERARGVLYDDLVTIENYLNYFLGKTFTPSGGLLPGTIAGDSSQDTRYVANTGPNHTPKWDTVNLGNGVQGRLPFGHLVQSTAPSVLVGRESGSAGNFEQIMLGPGLIIVGTQLDTTGAGQAAAAMWMAVDGADGAEGSPIPGPQGTPGSGGTPGATGAPGMTVIGLDGFDGQDGFTIPGTPGTAGGTGAAGSAGAAGPPGFGLDGQDGQDSLSMPSGLTQLVGDGTAGPGSGPQTFTLAASGAVAGAYGGATQSAVVTVDAKGRITGITTATITPGAGSGGALTQLAQIITSGSQATVDFTSIPGGYSALKILYFSQDTHTGTSGEILRVRLNNDSTAADYTSSQRIGGQNGGSYSSAVASSAGGVMIGAHPDAGNTGSVGQGEITLVGYAGTTFHKRILSFMGYDDNTNAGNVGNFVARWKSTAAVTRITITTDGTAFLDGSTFTLYGLS